MTADARLPRRRACRARPRRPCARLLRPRGAPECSRRPRRTGRGVRPRGTARRRSKRCACGASIVTCAAVPVDQVFPGRGRGRRRSDEDQARSSGAMPPCPVALVRAIPDMVRPVVCPAGRRQPALAFAEFAWPGAGLGVPRRRLSPAPRFLRVSDRDHESHPSHAPTQGNPHRHRLLRGARYALRRGLDVASGARGLRVHGGPRPARREERREHSAVGDDARREERAPRRLPRCPRARGDDRRAMRRVSPLDRRQEILQHHPARPRRDDDRHHPRHARRRGGHFLRRKHPQGKRHSAVLSLRRPRQPFARDLQALARSGVRRRVRRAKGDERVPRVDRPRLHDVDPRRPTRPTPTCWARRTRRRISSASTAA